MKKVFALVLALAMIFALAVPAMAAEPTYSITIDHPSCLITHTYEAYQIFSGVIDATGSKLSEVEWGTGVDSAKLLEALDKDAAWGPKVDTTTSAEELADLLAHKDTTTAMFETFRTLAGASLTTTVAATANTAVDEKYVLNLDAAGAGYYLVKDQDGSLKDTLETYSNYMLRVVGQDTLHPKGGSIVVKKDIIDGGSAKEAADYSIGDTVHFRVTGTLPTNYGSFTEFYYEIADEMSAGLTYTAGSVKVYLENHGSKLELTNPTDPAATPFFTVNSADAQHVNVVFNDLKAITGRTIDASTVIIMEYDAVLNAAAEIGEPGNRNDAWIIFDNNPYVDGRGKTPEDYAWAFTWELDTHKTDDLGNSLAGAKFVFYRESEGAKQYVILENNKVKGWTANKDEATVIVSEKDKVIPIIGLEADTYYLEETEAPDGYNLLDAPVTIIITATAKGPDGAGGFAIDTFNVKFGTGDIVDGDKTSGIVEGTVVNKSGTVLPETGGIGTTMFYIFGSLLFVGAAVLLVTKKRMAY